VKACILSTPAPSKPIRCATRMFRADSLDPHQVLIRIRACGVCRTDLHVVEGELIPRKSPVIPGHQVVGVVEKTGAAVTGST